MSNGFGENHAMGSTPPVPCGSPAAARAKNFNDR
jgi:hypothetical protein